VLLLALMKEKIFVNDNQRNDIELTVMARNYVVAPLLRALFLNILATKPGFPTLQLAGFALI
jgi:hypothetical protein